MTWIYWKVAHSGGVRGESQWIWGGAVQSDHFAMLGLHLHPTCFNVKFEFYQLKLGSIGPVWIITAVFNLNGHGHSLPSGKSNCPHCPNAVPHLHYVYHTCTTCTTFCTTCAQTPYWHRWSADQNASYQLELRRGATTIFEEIIFSLIATLPEGGWKAWKWHRSTLSPLYSQCPPQRASHNLTQILTTLFIPTFTSFTSWQGVTQFSTWVFMTPQLRQETRRILHHSKTREITVVHSSTTVSSDKTRLTCF